MAAKKPNYLTVDRVEDGVVIMIDEKESIYRITTDMLGLVPRDGDVLRVTVDADGMIQSAEVDAQATEERRAAMRAKLQSMLG
ncbi:MAG: DUF3006 domain-containing protein [Ruminococcaceae bacterium]|nr:DUF3006 domain-containing protein [Oscillospiraceae bacterium]